MCKSNTFKITQVQTVLKMLQLAIFFFKILIIFELYFIDIEYIHITIDIDYAHKL